MTLVNLLANIVTPHYPTLHMVGTPMMAEADSRGAKFEGIIAEVPGDSAEQAVEMCSK